MENNTEVKTYRYLGRREVNLQTDIRENDKKRSLNRKIFSVHMFFLPFIGEISANKGQSKRVLVVLETIGTPFQIPLLARFPPIKGF